MAVTIIGASPSFGNTFKNTWSVEDLDITYLISNRDSLVIPTDSTGLNPVFTEANIIYTIVNRNESIDEDWVISSYSTTDVTITVNNATKTVNVTAIDADLGNFIIKATKTGENTLYSKISVFKSYAGADGTDGTSGGGTTQETNGSIHPLAVTGAGILTLGDNSIDLQTYTYTDRGALGKYNFVTGRSNLIGASADSCVISGGFLNSITASDDMSVIGGGNANNITSGGANLIPGGVSNTISAILSNAIGSEHTVNNSLSTAIGYGGTSSTAGEIIFSNTNSAAQKSIFILEGESIATETVTLKTFARTTNSYGVTSSNIIIANNTAFSGNIVLTGTRTGPEFSNKKLALGWVCDASGNVTTKLGTEDTNYQDNSQFDAVLSFVTTNTNELIVTIVADDTDCKWVAIVEGIIMDI